MSDPRTPRSRSAVSDMDPSLEEDATVPTSVASEEPAPPAPQADIAPAPPTLRDAFYVLCQALEACLEEDMPGWTKTQEIQGWMMNSGDDAGGLAQQALAWTHAVALLEGVLGRPLLQR